MSKIMFYRDQTIGKGQRSCSVRPIGFGTDEGDTTAVAESITLECSGPGHLFVFFCNFIGRSNQLNSPPMAQFLSSSFKQKKLAPIGRRMENLWPFYARALIFVRYTLGGQENFVGMGTENSCGIDHVPQILDNTKMLEIMFCPPCRCQKRLWR